MFRLTYLSSKVIRYLLEREMERDTCQLQCEWDGVGVGELLGAGSGSGRLE